MLHFDMHVHPTLKAGLTDDPENYSAWSDIPFFAQFPLSSLLNSFKEIFTSQSNLTQLTKAGTVSVMALVGIEKAFAGNWAIRKILASPKVSPLSRRLLTDVVKGNVSYYDMFLRDLNVLINGPRREEFVIVKKFDELSADKMNLILSVEGAHSFQSAKDEMGEAAIAESIITNFTNWKNDPRFRLHHFTVTHLTRQPACVHCFGVNVTVLGLINITRDINFQPDPARAGISPLGVEVIRRAYDAIDSKPVLVDIKHMSYLSRLQFYKLREANGWQAFPLVASHVGVTGTTFAGSSVGEIEEHPDGCSFVSWNRKRGLRNTVFNPWTINLFDEEIVEILKSGGIIGVSLDQRILGYQKKFFGEFMSPAEIRELPFPPVGEKLVDDKNFTPPLKPTKANTEDRTILDNPELIKFLELDGFHSPDFIDEDQHTILGNDMIFEIEEKEEEDVAVMPVGEDHHPFKAIDSASASHIDYIANNILHIIRVGFQNGYDGKDDHLNVTDFICIGSDLDGIVDSANFPRPGRDTGIDKKDWITSDEYPRLQTALIHSMQLCIAEDAFLQSLGLDVNVVVGKVMYHNGIAFLKKHFN